MVTQPVDLEPVTTQEAERVRRVVATELELWGALREETIARAASVDLYPPEGTSGTVLVPRLDLPGLKTTDPITALRTNPLLFGPAWRLAFRMGALPVKVFAIDPATGTRVDVPTHPAYALLRRPNDKVTRNHLVSGSVMTMFSHLAVGWLKVRESVDGPPFEVWPIPAGMLHPVRSSRGLYSGFEIRTMGYPPVPVREKDICYFRLMPDPVDWSSGLSPFSTLGTVADMGGKAIEAGSEMFDNAMLQRLWIDLHGKELTAKSLTRLSAQLEAARADRFKIPVMEDGASLETMGQSADPGVMVEAMTAANMLIERILGIPEDGNQKLYYAEAIQPIADVLEQELERSLMSEWPDQPAFPEFGFREVMKGDPAARIEMHARAILSAQETPDEARRDENRAPLPNGAGAQAFVPLNLVPIEMASVGVPTVPEHLLEVDTKEEAVATGKKADTKGGLGGAEGRETRAKAKGAGGTRPRGGDVPDTYGRKTYPGTKRPLSGEQKLTVLKGGASIPNIFKTMKHRHVTGQGEAAARRIRGLLASELRSLKSQLMSLTGLQDNAVVVEVPSKDALAATFAATQVGVHRLLMGHMDATGKEAMKVASELTGEMVPETYRLINTVMTEDDPAEPLLRLGLDVAYRDRAELTVEAYRRSRVAAVNGILSRALEEQLTGYELRGLMNRRYDALSGYGARGLAVTEMSAAWELAVSSLWRSQGYLELYVTRGEDACATSVCDDIVARGVLTLAEDLPPFHAGCGCFTLPYDPGLDVSSPSDGES